MKRITLIITGAIIILGFVIPINSIFVENMYTDEVYVLDTFSSKDTFTMRWIHSVELEPWEEIFTVNDGNELVLLKTRFKAFGAGVPDSAGEETYIEDGYVVHDKINQIIPDLTYGISPIAKHVIIIKDSTYPLYEMLPADTGIRISVKKISLIKYLKEKMHTS